MNELQFVLSTDLSGIPAEIEFNFEELKTALPELLAPYQNLVVTADSVKSAKGDKAKLNKLKTAIEDQRKAVKKQCLSPYEAFEPKCKEITCMIDEAIQAIDRQVKEFDKKADEEKWAKLFVWFTKRNTLKWLDINAVINPKWKNKTASMETLISEMEERITQVEADYSMICKKYQNPAIIQKFEETLSVSDTVTYADTLNGRQNAPVAVSKPDSVNLPDAPAKADTVQSEPNQGYQIVTFQVKLENNQKGFAQVKALAEFLKTSGIKYHVIRK